MTLDLTRLRALCFDIDGTLANTDDQMVQRLERLLHPLRGVFPNRNPRSFARRLVMALESPANTLYHWMDHLGLDGPAARMYGRLANLGGSLHKKKKYWLVPHTREVVEQLSQRYPLGIVTARMESDTMQFLEQFDLLRFFTAIATVQTCTHTKPFPDPLLWTVAKLGVTPAECAMIGDTIVDIHAGKAAGAQTIGLLCGFGRADELRRAGADLILNGPEGLVKALLIE